MSALPSLFSLYLLLPHRAKTGSAAVFTVEGNGVHPGRGGQQNRVQGIVLAVREIGSDDADVSRFIEFNTQMHGIARLCHNNILCLHGFYHAPNEMLLVHDFVANGSHANIFIKSNHIGASGPRRRAAPCCLCPNQAQGKPPHSP
uniref:Serine-threonine/tyrosine-protein kinase catalytic domain-containing protein n=1 Tax=Oryza meridionalis TaxID=40149 RepID=A0A0E0F8F6_9ORYZ